MWVGFEETCNCHARHSNAFERIPLALVPDAARAFAVELFGEAKAAAYFARFYAPTVADPSH
jgi:hypothetical protein